MEPKEIYQILEEAYFGDNIHENQELAAFRGLIKGAGVFVDVGASLGQYTYNANKVMENGTIYAIEADPVRYNRLLELAEVWQSESSNKIEIIHSALGDSIGEIKFFTSNSNISGGLFIRELDVPNVQWEEITVNCITLDSLLPDTKVDFIKIDVEGAEYRVLKGAEKTLKNSSPQVLVEIHSGFDKDRKHAPVEVFDIFYHHKYSYSKIYDHFLFVKNPSLSLKEHFQYLKGIWKRKIKNALKR